MDQAFGTMDTMYNDFITKLLPTIQEGLVITKDYFVDLFGRYVTYLIVTDVLALLAAGFTLFMLVKTSKKFVTKWKTVVKENAGKEYWARDNDGPAVFGMVIGACFIGSIASSTIMYQQGMDIAKAVFIPEVRVYEEVMDYKNRSEMGVTTQ